MLEEGQAREHLSKLDLDRCAAPMAAEGASWYRYEYHQSPFLSLNNHSDWERCLSSGAKQVTLVSRKGGMKIQGTASQPASPRSLSDGGTTASPGNYFQTCGGHEGDKESRA